MNNRLEKIIVEKKQEIQDLHHQLKKDATLAACFHEKINPRHTKSMQTALSQPSLAVIAEIKRRSPSMGALAEIKNPLTLAEKYIAGGAGALSVLTDKKFFNGSLDDLKTLSIALQNAALPILRKDFILDEIQIAESALAGADAILCIVAILQERTRDLIQFAAHFNLDVIVEVHDQQELAQALDCGAKIIGVNNRNLKTFVVDTNVALKLIESIPDPIVKIAESGIHDPLLAQRYYRAGYDAVLIGEALVKSTHPAYFIEACRHDTSAR